VINLVNHLYTYSTDVIRTHAMHGQLTGFEFGVVKLDTRRRVYPP
jgi:hypothetical protein